MIQLEYLPASETHCNVDPEQMVNIVKQTAASQKQLGLGDPQEAANQLIESYSFSVLYKHGFKEVKRPSRLHFMPFLKTYEYNNYAEYAKENPSDEPKEFPKFAQVLLSERLSTINLTVERISKNAAIPLMPMSVQALVRKVKDLIPSIRLHMLFQPMWIRGANPDPVIIGEAGGHYFEIARWGGDASLLEEFLENVQTTTEI